MSTPAVTASLTKPPPSDRKLKIASALRRRRWMLISLASIAALAALLCLCDWMGLFGYHGDDQARFDNRSFIVRSIDGPAALTIDVGGRPVTIALLGDAPADQALSAEAVRLLKEKTAGRKVRIRLDGLTRRDGANRLLAYVFADDTISLNEHLIRQGLVRADRNVQHGFAGAFAAGEAAARRKKLGTWASTP